MQTASQPVRCPLLIYQINYKLLIQDTGNEHRIMFLVLSYIWRGILNEAPKAVQLKTCSSFLFDISGFHQRYLVALTWTWCELVVWVSSGVSWIKQRCSRGRTGQHCHGSGVCRSQISRINYCNVSYQFPPGLCQLCTKRGTAVKLYLKGSYRQTSSIWWKDVNFYQYSLRLGLLWLLNSLIVLWKFSLAAISILNCGTSLSYRIDMIYLLIFIHKFFNLRLA